MVIPFENVDFSKYSIDSHDDKDFNKKHAYLSHATNKLLDFENKILDYPVNSKADYFNKNKILNAVLTVFHNISIAYNVVEDDSYALAYGEVDFLSDIVDNEVLVANVRHNDNIITISRKKPRFMTDSTYQKITCDY